MTLKKAYGSKVLNGIEVQPQREVDMHPLEEAAILAHWAIHEIQKQIPRQLFPYEEQELLITDGIEAVRQKRKDRQDIVDSIKTDLDAAHKLAEDSHKAWSDHALLCRLNGMDPDTFSGDARDKLTMPNMEIKNG